MSLILNQQVLLFLTSGLLQLALVAVILAVGAANLQKNQSYFSVALKIDLKGFYNHVRLPLYLIHTSVSDPAMLVVLMVLYCF